MRSTEMADDKITCSERGCSEPDGEARPPKFSSWRPTYLKSIASDPASDGHIGRRCRAALGPMDLPARAGRPSLGRLSLGGPAAGGRRFTRVTVWMTTFQVRLTHPGTEAWWQHFWCAVGARHAPCNWRARTHEEVAERAWRSR